MLTFVVALHCEAKPIIDFYKLKKVIEKPFDLYQRGADGVNPPIDLLVTGIGALSVSAGVGWLAGRDSENETQRVWLNVGTAGHFDQPLGAIFLVHGVGDEVLQKSHYPPMVAKWSGITGAVLTVNAPCSDYPGGAAVDMEAFAFFTAANRFSDSELVQSLKVVSDNQELGIEHLSAKKLTELILENIDKIDQYAHALLSINPEKYIYEQRLFEGVRGSHSQRLQANELLKRLCVLYSDRNEVEVFEASLQTHSHLKDILPELRKAVDAVTPSLAS